MEEVEEANRAAVESCNRVLTLLSPQYNNSKDQVLLQCRSLAMETDEAVLKFKRVVSLLSHGRRVRKLQKTLKPSTNLPHRIFLDSPNVTNTGLNVRPAVLSPKPLQIIPSNFFQSPLQVSPYQRLQQFHHHHQQQQQQQQQQQHMMMYSSGRSSNNSGINLKFDGGSSSCGTPSHMTASTKSLISSLSLDCSSNSFHFIGLPKQSSGSQISQQQHSKNRCSGRGEDGGSISIKCSTTGKCHCSKKRKHRVKRSIRVPAISNKVADIPPDEYSWRKYGQKPIKGSPHPRGYYKCSSVRGCPARKHVERCPEEPSMLIVTYEDDHNHSRMIQASQSAHT